MKLSLLFAGLIGCSCLYAQQAPSASTGNSKQAVKHDVSKPFRVLYNETRPVSTVSDNISVSEPSVAGKKTMDQKAIAVEQTGFGSKTAPLLVTSFDGLGESFTGPQGTAIMRNPSDNSLAVGLDHVVQTVNSHMAIFTKKGKKYTESGKIGRAHV